MRKPLPILAALGLAVAGLASTVPAQAAPACTITGFSPHAVTVGLSPVVSPDFRPTVTGCQLTYWNIEGDSFYVYPDAPSWTFNPYDNAQATPEDVIVTVYNEDSEQKAKVYGDSFTLKRRTAWSPTGVNASPEPVKKGAKLTITGRLFIANWSTQHYDGYAKRTVAVEFRTATGPYKQVKTAVTGAGGYLTTTVTAVQDGTWRFRYGGNTYASAATAVGDTVDVR